MLRNFDLLELEIAISLRNITIMLFVSIIFWQKHENIEHLHENDRIFPEIW